MFVTYSTQLRSEGQVVEYDMDFSVRNVDHLLLSLL